jgi:hypothetical protein
MMPPRQDKPVLPQLPPRSNSRDPPFIALNKRVRTVPKLDLIGASRLDPLVVEEVVAALGFAGESQFDREVFSNFPQSNSRREYRDQVSFPTAVNVYELRQLFPVEIVRKEPI